MSLDTQTTELLRQLGLQPDPPQVGMMEIGVHAAREGSRAVFHAYAGDVPAGCHAEDVPLPGTEHSVPARLYRPATDAWPPSSMVVFLHGGGWSMGDLECYDFFMRDLCVRSGASILSVEYRLAPEHKYPAALDDGLAAVRWATSLTRAHAGDAARVAVMGDSAGGNLAAVIARRLHIEGRIRLAGQLLLYPMLDVSQPHAAYPSRMRYGDGEYLLTRESIDTAATWYLDGIGRRDDPDVSPLLVEDLSMLPETVIVIGGHDPLLDEARLYAERLLAAGVAARFKMFCDDDPRLSFLRRARR
ncbi:MAG: alpha/beta hydrolase, partial [Steroidobacteraceae bacterium]